MSSTVIPHRRAEAARRLRGRPLSRRVSRLWAWSSTGELRGVGACAGTRPYPSPSGSAGALSCYVGVRCSACAPQRSTSQCPAQTPPPLRSPVLREPVRIDRGAGLPNQPARTRSADGVRASPGRRRDRARRGATWTTAAGSDRDSHMGEPLEALPGHVVVIALRALVELEAACDVPAGLVLGHEAQRPLLGGDGIGHAAVLIEEDSECVVAGAAGRVRTAARKANARPARGRWRSA
jgi:hypothetical protein